MSAIFVLIMIFGNPNSNASVTAILSQEFASLETCEAARRALVKTASQKHDGLSLRTHGCFKK